MASTITDRASGLGVASDPNGEDATVSLKRPVRAATTANITLEGAQTIDGVSIVADDRVLVKDQTTGSENGIYIAATGDWTRPKDCVDDGDLVTGTEVRVNEGTTNQGRFYCASTDPIDIGTDTITWTQVTGISVADGDKGDIVISSSGTVFTIGANAVGFSELLDATQEALIGAGTSGAFQEITLGTGLAISSGVLSFTIQAKSVSVAMLADGTDGELLTWDAAGEAATVPVGTAAQVLTSNGAGAAPTFQDPAGAPILVQRTRVALSVADDQTGVIATTSYTAQSATNRLKFYLTGEIEAAKAGSLNGDTNTTVDVRKATVVQGYIFRGHKRKDSSTLSEIYSEFGNQDLSAGSTSATTWDAFASGGQGVDVKAAGFFVIEEYTG